MYVLINLDDIDDRSWEWMMLNVQFRNLSAIQNVLFVEINIRIVKSHLVDKILSKN